MPIAHRRSGTTLAAVLTSVLLVTSLSLLAKGPGQGNRSRRQSRRAPTLIVDDAALGDEASGDNWLAYGRTYSEQRFSPLTQIDDRTVSRLGPDWVLELPGDRGLVSTPLVVDGVLYFIGSMNVVRAVDATVGQAALGVRSRRSRAQAGRLRVCWDHNRGIGFWKGKVYAATRDGRLIAIDAQERQGGLAAR